MRIYTNYNQIDEDLKILKLQTEIDKEKVKLSVNEIKEDLSPVSLVTSLFSAVVKRAFIIKAASKLLGR
ncbi:DUF6327 family protein [Mesonia sediminis]|jgi:hypothetical protein|uniref:DUF6327 family protein n=1 Tax=Mesonia sediminis TaxID=1703946 RepID=A0ABW5SEC5_9FLAO